MQTTKGLQPRMAVIYKGKRLSPITYKRADKLIKKGFAIPVKDKQLGWYLKLKKKPSNNYIQPLTLGIDPGTMFDGYSVVGKVVEQNFELEHSQVVRIKNYLKGKSAERRMYRRTRRSRIWNREAKYNNRTGNKITNTANYYFQARQNIVSRITKFFPVKKIVIEDVASIHNGGKGQNNFSNLEVGKNRLYDMLRSFGKLKIYRGSRTFKFRCNQKLFKTKNKALKDFSAHCVDSYSLACITNGFVVKPIKHLLYISRFATKDSIRRKLFREKLKIRDACKYFRWHNGQKIFFQHLSKLKK
jgi:hypothetical protein